MVKSQLGLSNIQLLILLEYHWKLFEHYSVLSAELWKKVFFLQSFSQSQNLYDTVKNSLF